MYIVYDDKKCIQNELWWKMRLLGKWDDMRCVLVKYALRVGRGCRDLDLLPKVFYVCYVSSYFVSKTEP
jgi:hypothetical protein